MRGLLLLVLCFVFSHPLAAVPVDGEPNGKALQPLAKRPGEDSTDQAPKKQKSVKGIPAQPGEHLTGQCKVTKGSSFGTCQLKRSVDVPGSRKSYESVPGVLCANKCIARTATGIKGHCSVPFGTNGKADCQAKPMLPGSAQAIGAERRRQRKFGALLGSSQPQSSQSQSSQVQSSQIESSQPESPQAVGETVFNMDNPIFDDHGEDSPKDPGAPPRFSSSPFEEE